MNDREKEIIKPISQINLAIYTILGAVWVTALNDGYYSLNFVGNTVFVVGFLAFGVAILLFGVRGFNRVKTRMNTDSALKYFELAPNIAGVGLMGSAAYVMSIYKSYSQPNSIPPFYVWHPYSAQAFILFLAGSLALALSFLMYQHFVPKQIVKRCRFCGFENPYENTFCHRCGQNIAKNTS